jgi:hypothetical protein
VKLDGEARVDHAIHGSGEDGKVEPTGWFQAPGIVAQLGIDGLIAGHQSHVVEAIGKGKVDDRGRIPSG